VSFEAIGHGWPHPDRPNPDRRVFERVPSSAKASRDFVRDRLLAYGAERPVVADFELTVSELVTNVIEHGGGSSRLEVVVSVADPSWWEIQVIGGAWLARRGPSPVTWSVPGALELSGRGLGIVRRLMDDVILGTVRRQISIRCRRHRP
jgi:anti-sigma regulatory factor (Ser/Thr protein kinase)